MNAAQHVEPKRTQTRPLHLALALFKAAATRVDQHLQHGMSQAAQPNAQVPPESHTADQRGHGGLRVEVLQRVVFHTGMGREFAAVSASIVGYRMRCDASGGHTVLLMTRVR